MEAVELGRDPTIQCDVKLPDKLSDLIRVAVNDCKSLDSKTYCPDSESWHEPNEDFVDGGSHLPVCVCLAGAVIAKSLGQPPTARVTPNSFISTELSYKLDALEEVREGRLIQAFDYMAMATGMPVIPQGSCLEAMVHSLPDPPYPGFKGFFEMHLSLAHLESAATRLERLGL